MRLSQTLKEIEGDFVLLDLGSAHPAGALQRVPEVMAAVTLVEVDLHPNHAQGEGRYFKQIRLCKGVAGTRAKRLFRTRAFPDVSSFLEPKPDLIRAYGLADYFLETAVAEVECEPVTSLLRKEGLTRVDFFKTDLEGLDAEVLMSDSELVGRALCVQCELRFQPFYVGEPVFHVVAAYLADLGLELISMRPAVWKYATSHRAVQRDGRWVWADVLFFLSPSQVQKQFGQHTWKMFAKQIILARLLGLGNYAEHLFCETHSLMPPAIERELSTFVTPSFSLPRSVLATVNRLPAGWMVIGAMRRVFGYLWTTTAIYRDAISGDF
jgi:hypothetical protein